MGDNGTFHYRLFYVQPSCTHGTCVYFASNYIQSTPRSTCTAFNSLRELATVIGKTATINMES